MFIVRMIGGCAHPLGEDPGREQAAHFDRPAFAVDPLRLYWVKPRALYPARMQATLYHLGDAAGSSRMLPGAPGTLGG